MRPVPCDMISRSLASLGLMSSAGYLQRGVSCLLSGANTPVGDSRGSPGPSSPTQIAGAAQIVPKPSVPLAAAHLSPTPVPERCGALAPGPSALAALAAGGWGGE